MYTTKEGDGVKSAVKVKGMEKEPFNTEEGKAKCFHHSPTEMSFCPPSFFCFIIPQCQTNSCCFSICPLPPFSDPMCSIFPQVLPVSLPIIVSLVLFCLFQLAQLLPQLPSVLFTECPGPIDSGNLGNSGNSHCPTWKPTRHNCFPLSSSCRLTVQLSDLDNPLAPDNNSSLPSDLWEEGHRMSRLLCDTGAQSPSPCASCLLSNLRNKLWVQSNPTPRVLHICRHHSVGGEALTHEILVWSVQLGPRMTSAFTGD